MVSEESWKVRGGNGSPQKEGLLSLAALRLKWDKGVGGNRAALYFVPPSNRNLRC